MLVQDGSLEVANSAVRQKMLEQDPVQQTDAAGKKPAAARSARKEAREDRENEKTV